MFGFYSGCRTWFLPSLTRIEAVEKLANSVGVILWDKGVILSMHGHIHIPHILLLAHVCATY